MSEEYVEIPRSKLELLEGVSKLNNELWNDSQYGMQIKEIVKAKYPNANIPEVDMVRETRKAESEILSKVEQERVALEARMAAWEAKQTERDEKDAQTRAEKEFAAEVEAGRKKYALTQEGIDKVFARMKEKNNPDFESAAAWVTDHQAAAAPVEHSGYGPQSMNAFGSTAEDKDWELLNRNPWDMKFADKEIRQITQDFANGRGDRYGANGMGGEL